MLNPTQMPGSIADSVEFVKKLWGIPSAGALPGMLIPTLSIEEINKKITDLKAVESWLTVNMNMLRGTIQALEVQSATIVNLQSMGAMLSAQQAETKTAMAAGAAAFPFSFPGWPPAGGAADAASVPAPTPSSAAAFSSPFSMPFSSPFSRPAAAEPEAAAAPQPPEPPIAVAPLAAAPAAVDTVADGSKAAGSTAEASAGAPNPNAWWDLLQNQFKQAVGTALLPDALKVAAAGKQTGDAAKPARKAVVAKTTSVAGKAAKIVKSASGAAAKKSGAGSKG